MKTSDNRVRTLILAGMFLATALVLPFLTGQIPQLGNALCPMHLPVLLCGFFCGPWYGLAVGFVAPLLRFVLFGMPPIMPTGLAMAFELAAYGCFSGLLYIRLPKRVYGVYVALVCSMVLGRIVWGVASVLLYSVSGTVFGWELFLTGGFVSAIPGIAVQLLIIPPIVAVLRKYTANS